MKSKYIPEALLLSKFCDNDDLTLVSFIGNRRTQPLSCFGRHSSQVNAEKRLIVVPKRSSSFEETWKVSQQLKPTGKKLTKKNPCLTRRSWQTIAKVNVSMQTAHRRASRNYLSPYTSYRTVCGFCHSQGGESRDSLELNNGNNCCLSPMDRK